MVSQKIPRKDEATSIRRGKPFTEDNQASQPEMTPQLDSEKTEGKGEESPVPFIGGFDKID